MMGMQILVSHRTCRGTALLASEPLTSSLSCLHLHRMRAHCQSSLGQQNDLRFLLHRQWRPEIMILRSIQPPVIGHLLRIIHHQNRLGSVSRTHHSKAPAPSLGRKLVLWKQQPAYCCCIIVILEDGRSARIRKAPDLNHASESSDKTQHQEIIFLVRNK